MDRLILSRIDFDLAERIFASGPVKKLKPPKSTKRPRLAATYRGVRRNAALQARRDAKKFARQVRRAA